MSTWRNEFGETLRVEWEDDHAVLYHSDYDDVPLDLDMRVVAFDRTQDTNELSQLQLLQRPQLGDVVLSADEQKWLLGELVKLGMLNERARS